LWPEILTKGKKNDSTLIQNKAITAERSRIYQKSRMPNVFASKCDLGINQEDVVVDRS